MITTRNIDELRYRVVILRSQLNAASKAYKASSYRFPLRARVRIAYMQVEIRLTLYGAELMLRAAKWLIRDAKSKS